MLGWVTLKRIFNVDHTDGSTRYQDSSDQAESVIVNLRELEASQGPLKQAVADTGFFLGDALVRQTDDRARARHNNH